MISLGICSLTLLHVVNAVCLSRLAGESQEKWLQEEMKPVAETLILSGRNITLVAQKLHLQPECQCHQEELVTTAQQILVNTTKVRLCQCWLVMSSMDRHVIPTVDTCPRE